MKYRIILFIKRKYLLTKHFIDRPLFILIRLILAFIVVVSGFGCTFFTEKLTPLLLSIATIIIMFPEDISELYDTLKRFLPKLIRLIMVRK